MMAAYTQGFAQEMKLHDPIDYIAYKKPLKTAITELSRQTGVNIAFSNDDIPDTLVSVKAQQMPLELILGQLLEGTKLVCEPVEQSLVIYMESAYRGASFTISGYVTDANSGEQILHADIYLEDFSTGTSSNDYGYYNLPLHRGRHVLVCSYLGYKKQRIPISLHKDLTLDIQLEQDERLLIDEVLITAVKPEVESIGMFRPDQVDLEALDKMVSLGGEDDILRLLYGRAGVLTGADGFGGMHVRGGNLDQNLILLDGVPIYNAEHAIGLYSIFNASVIKSSKLIKGDMPARYGGSTSSVLDIRTRNGDKNRIRGEYNLGLFTMKAGLEGPIVPGKVSYLVNFRRTYADLWIKSFRDYLNEQEDSQGATDYFNFDLNAKIHASLRPNQDLFLSYYRGGDQYNYDLFSQDAIVAGQPSLRESRKDNRAGWNNELLSLQWASNPSSSWHLNAALLYSRFTMSNFVFDWVSETTGGELVNYRFSERLFLSGIRDAGAQLNLEYFARGGNRVRLGFKSVHHRFSPAAYMQDNERYPVVQSASDLPGYDSLMALTDPFEAVAWENRVYVEQEQLIGNHTRMNIGLHLAHFLVEDQTNWRLEPRFLLHTKLAKNTYFSLAATMMSQFMHQIESSGLGFPSQIWLPSYGDIKPQRSWQLSMGLHQTPGTRVAYFLQAFYKNMDHMIMADASEPLDIRQDVAWNDKIPQGLGYSYGIESGFSYKTKQFRGDLNYTLSYAKRKFGELNGGLTFDHRYSRRHMLNLAINLRVASNVEFSMGWTYGTGNPYTFPTQIASFIEDGQVTTKFIYESLNNATLPDYHRLDFEFNVYNHFEWGRQKISLGAYNVYNRKNPFYISFNNRAANIDQLNPQNFKYVYVFPLVPVLNYSIQF